MATGCAGNRSAAQSSSKTVPLHPERARDDSMRRVGSGYQEKRTGRAIKTGGDRQWRPTQFVAVWKEDIAVRETRGKSATL